MGQGSRSVRKFTALALATSDRSRARQPGDAGAQIPKGHATHSVGYLPEIWPETLVSPRESKRSMSISSDRRATGVNRVPVGKTVVEICGRDAQVPAFEADAVELSGRGMHVRTEYLPELNAPLVLRFEDRGREVVVEGEVAWRREGEQSAEFGIKFTALDSRSVEVLRDLCTVDAAQPEAPKAVVIEQVGGVPGSPVKLHIEGLNAPMKARVRDSNGRKVQVGSNLEFLKVGRSIEVEDVDQGERRNAKIDSVTVAIDPQTQVPQLVVALRYAGEITPQPSVVDTSNDEDAIAEGGLEDDSLEAADEHVEELEDEIEAMPPSLHADAEDDDADDLAHASGNAGERLKERMIDTASRLGEMARHGGASVGALSVTAAKGFGRFAQGVGAQIATLRARSAASAPKRRTAGAPTSMSSEGRRIRLQPQHRTQGGPGSASRTEKGSGTTGKLRPGRMIAGAALLIVGTVGATLGFSGGGSREEKSHAAAAPVEQVTPQAAMQPNAQAEGAVSPQPPTLGAPAQAPQPTASEQTGIVADVPLFGPTTLATAQPEPLAPVQAAVAYEDQAPDQAFEETPQQQAEKESTEVKPEDVKPWVTGKLHLPTVHRLRLNAPGAALKGFSKNGGFSVLIPARKVTDNPKAIVKRDDRIKSVTADSSPEGAVITFKFRGPVPSHKVRLRNDYVEFFISAPGG